MRKDYLEIRLHHNQAMTYYVEVARKNRELIRRYNKLKIAIANSFMIGWTLVKVNDWMDMNDMDDFSFLSSSIEDKLIVDTTRYSEKKKIQKYNRLILNEYPTEEIKTAEV